jgi:hypothetical protein
LDATGVADAGFLAFFFAEAPPLRRLGEEQDLLEGMVVVRSGDFVTEFRTRLVYQVFFVVDGAEQSDILQPMDDLDAWLSNLLPPEMGGAEQGGAAADAAADAAFFFEVDLDQTTGGALKGCALEEEMPASSGGAAGGALEEMPVSSSSSGAAGGALEEGGGAGSGLETQDGGKAAEDITDIENCEVELKAAQPGQVAGLRTKLRALWTEYWKKNFRFNHLSATATKKLPLKRICILHIALMIAEDTTGTLRETFSNTDFDKYLSTTGLKHTGMMPWGWHGMAPHKKGEKTMFVTTGKQQMFAPPNPLKRVDPRDTDPTADGLSQYQFKSAAYDALLPFLDTYKALKSCAEDKRQIVNIDPDRKISRKRASPPLQGNEAQRGRVEAAM